MKKVLILILAYNAEKHIVALLNRLPASLWDNTEYATDVIVIDDCSKDNTSRVARAHFDALPYSIRLLRNTTNQGYGGNQKVGYVYAIENGYDAVVMLHGDGQYPPEQIPEMVAPLLRGEADAVFGSRMMDKSGALKGHMPYYKFAGNIVLTWLQNHLLGAQLSEFHSGYRAYSVAALKRIPFTANSNVFDFDTDIIIQLLDNRMIIKEIPIPTHYGDEICHVNGTKYAFDIMLSTLQSRVQKFGIFYAPKFDYVRDAHYHDKSGFDSSHSYAIRNTGGNKRVLVIGCSEGHVAAHLRSLGCTVTGCDAEVDESIARQYSGICLMDPDHPHFEALDAGGFDVVLLLDIIERLQSPEQFLAALHHWCVNTNPTLIITTPNIGFAVQRIMLLFGQFNYGKRGTLDMKHKRLFTFRSLARLLRNAGFVVESMEGVPAPFPVALGNSRLSYLLLKLNRLCIGLSKTLFSYQIALIARPMPTLSLLVARAIADGAKLK